MEDEEEIVGENAMCPPSQCPKCGKHTMVTLSCAVFHVDGIQCHNCINCGTYLGRW